MEFNQRKDRAMAALKAAEGDKSPKGSLDAPILPLLEAINRHPSYFTTSSCSGRISIFLHPPAANVVGPVAEPSQGSSGECKGHEEEENKEKKNKKKKKAGGGSWLFVSHELADPDALVELVSGDVGRGIGFAQGEVVFRFEPFILAVDCLDVAAAQALVSAAISCGFRESGITSAQKRVMVAIRCSIRLEVPLGQSGKIMVSPDYIRYLTEIANSKMEANLRRTDVFTNLLQTQVLLGSASVNTVFSKKEQGLIAKSVINIEAEQRNELLKQQSHEDHDLMSKQIFSSLEHVEGACHVDSKVIVCLEDKATITSCQKMCINSDFSHETKVGTRNVEITHLPSDYGIPESSKCSLSICMLVIVGEPSEKLFLWGQSTCKLSSSNATRIFVFGGFGGFRRHARRSCLLTLDPISGLLQVIDATSPPCPRVGHTLSVVGDNIFVVGGRGDPTQIFNDVWLLNPSENRWMLLECSGTMFRPRHRHTAVVVGSTIFVFGGLNNEVIYSSMEALNTNILEWSEVCVQGESPCARHSHSMVACGFKLFMFGGYDGERALGDLFSFDVRTCRWMKETTAGTSPAPRFSHSMFAYNQFLGILGGCPVSQHNEELFLLNLHHNVWIHVSIPSVGRELWVRSSVTVIYDDLVIIGGGASCYAFGTKFNPPMKISLNPLKSVNCDDSDEAKLMGDKKPECCSIALNTSHESSVNLASTCFANAKGYCSDAKQLILKIEKKYAKLAKDLLKKFGWLDLRRKMIPSEDMGYILIPLDQKFSSFFLEKNQDYIPNNFVPRLSITEGISASEVSMPMACSFLSSCGSFLVSEVADLDRRVKSTPKLMMRELISSLLCKKSLPLELLDQLPTRWEHLGNIVVLPVTSFESPMWNDIKDELWPLVAKSLGAERLALQGHVSSTGTRDSTLEILVGDDGWVCHPENGINYSFDATKCMFSKGNLSEKLRMARLDCSNEIIVDLFAGIGYFTLPFLVKAKAKLVYACEWNPHALKALQYNIHSNFVGDRCVFLEGDNLDTAPKGVADRVCLGLLPSSERSWLTAVKALRVGGGILHIHGTVNDSKEGPWLEHIVRSITSIAESEGLRWDVTVEHVERVKWYAPRIRHLVADVRCKHSQN